jgi:branched-chain amino acid transport system permease protein
MQALKSMSLRSRLGAGAAAAVLAALLFAGPECVNVAGELPLRFVGGLSSGSIYALIALGYTLVYGVLQLINFAHSEVFMFGTLGGLLSINALAGGNAEIGQPWMLFAALIPGALAAGLAAVLLERFGYRPLRRRGATRLSYLIAAIGASLFMQAIVLVWRGRGYENYPPTWEPYAVFQIGNVRISNHDLLVFGAMIAMLVGLDFLVQRTRIGKGIRAVAQDPETAEMMGVDINKIITVTFLVGGLLAGVAGVLYTLRFNTRFDIGFIPGIKAFTAAVLGGIGNIRGALVGGLALGIMENVGAGCFGDAWKNVIAFMVLVLVLMFRPTGLLGEGTGASGQKA